MARESRKERIDSAWRVIRASPHVIYQAYMDPGIGQRRFFLHDGRTADLQKAIEAHYSPGTDCDDDRARQSCYGPSEANAVIGRFRALAPADKQAILDFLRSL